MEWTIDYLEDEGIIYGKVRGDMTWEEQKKLAEEYIKYANQHGVYKILSNESEAKTTFPMLELDKLPKYMREVGAPENKESVAIVYNPSDENKRKYFKSIAHLASFNFRVFDDEQKALAWLKSS